MYAGVIVEEADVGAIFATPLHPYTQGLLELRFRPLAPGASVDASTLFQGSFRTWRSCRSDAASQTVVPTSMITAARRNRPCRSLLSDRLREVPKRCGAGCTSRIANDGRRNVMPKRSVMKECFPMPERPPTTTQATSRCSLQQACGGIFHCPEGYFERACAA